MSVGKVFSLSLSASNKMTWPRITRFTLTPEEHHRAIRGRVILLLAHADFAIKRLSETVFVDGHCCRVPPYIRLITSLCLSLSLLLSCFLCNTPSIYPSQTNTLPYMYVVLYSANLSVTSGLMAALSKRNFTAPSWPFTGKSTKKEASSRCVVSDHFKKYLC